MLFRSVRRVTGEPLPQRALGVGDASFEIALGPVFLLVGLTEAVEFAGRLAPATVRVVLGGCGGAFCRNAGIAVPKRVLTTALVLLTPGWHRCRFIRGERALLVAV